MKVEHRGYVIEQSKYNNHITIFKDNELVFHLSLFTDNKFSEDELKAIINIFMFDREEED